MFKSLDELYKDLIRHGADPTAHEDKTESESIIHCAAAAGKLKFCETLLDLHDPHTRSKRVVDVNTVDAKERTPLINAAEAGDISVLCTCLWLNTMPTSGWEMGLAMMRSWRLVVGVMSVLPHFSWGGGSFVMGSCVIATWTRRISKRFLCYIFAVALGHVEVVEFLVGCKCGEYKIGGRWGIDGERGVLYVWPGACYSGATWDGTAGTGFYGFPTEVKWVRSSSVHHCLVCPWDFQIMRTFKRIASSPSSGRTFYYEDAHKILTARRCYP